MPVTAARCWDRVMSEAGRIPTFLGLMLQKGRQRVNESTEMCEILPGKDKEIEKNKAGWGDSDQGSSVHGILQAGILEWVACHFLPQAIFPTQGLNQCLLHRGRFFIIGATRWPKRGLSEEMTQVTRKTSQQAGGTLLCTLYTLYLE